MALTTDEKREAIALLEELERRKVRRKILTYFPDTGPLRRELYPKHIEFFAAGQEYRERLCLAANRIGKTEGMGGYELTRHLTGQYPAWWKGRRFEHPIRAWAAGTTGETVREILQQKLFGPPSDWGTGLIPGDSIQRIVKSPGVPDSIDLAYIKHGSGSTSVLSLKSYEQGFKTFQGTEQDVIWLDEEPPLAVYTECLLRTMTNNGLIMCTFTPLLGLSDVVLNFLPDGQLTEKQHGTKYVIMATWDDAPHLSKEAKDELWKSIPPYQRDARSKGIPQLGSGAIYPVPESDFIVAPFQIPDYWPQGYGMDVGWNCTGAVFGALDREHDTLYLTYAHKRSQEQPVIHAAGIKAAAGVWMPGFIDPAARGRNQKDGSQLIAEYQALGLNLEVALNAVESGIYEVWTRLSTGRLKVFANMQEWLAEYRLYRRDEKGRVVKSNDHLMDCTRYLVSRLDGLRVKRPHETVVNEGFYSTPNYAGSWMT